MGTLGAGNHYAEIQIVDHVFDAAAARKMGIDRVGQARARSPPHPHVRARAPTAKSAFRQVSSRRLTCGAARRPPSLSQRRSRGRARSACSVSGCQGGCPGPAC